MPVPLPKSPRPIRTPEEAYALEQLRQGARLLGVPDDHLEEWADTCLWLAQRLTTVKA